MFTFLLEEGVLTVGTLSGIFTAAMLVSFKNNILEPVIEKVCPHKTLDKESFIIDLSGEEKKKPEVDKGYIKWQTFLRDFLSWCMIMFALYLFWKLFLHKYKKG
jgi:large-conductance mechanosensitive channel